MMSIWQLLRVYCSGAAWQAWFTIIGWTMVIAALANIQRVAGSFVLQAVAFAACAAIFAGTALMPRIVGQLARTHAIQFLPFARIKLLVSALLTTAIVALPLPVLSVFVSRVAFTRVGVDPAKLGYEAIVDFLALPFLWNLVANVFLFCTFLYGVLWFVTNSRTVLGKVLTLIIAVALLSIPPRFVSRNPDASVAPVIAMIVAYWLVIACAFIFGRRLRLRQRLSRLALFASGRTSSISRNEAMRLMLGIANPWSLALAVALCIALDTLFVTAVGPWLFFLSILAIVANAVTGLAASRGRTLWLRQAGSRDQLFAGIERMLWRHGLLSLAVMEGWLVAVATFSDAQIALIAYGTPLIGVSAACSFYLGLMQTRGLHWSDGVLAIVTTLAIMYAALLIARPVIDPPLIIGLECALCVAALGYRWMAKHRWSELDWAMFRSLQRIGANG